MPNCGGQASKFSDLNQALKHLTDKGFLIGNNGIIHAPKDYVWDQADNDAADYLFGEWDFVTVDHGEIPL